MLSHETEPPDHLLVQRALAGVDSAFAALFHRYYDRIRAFAYRMVLDHQASDDIAQECFIRAAAKLGGLREDQAFAAWIFRVASNAARDHLRAQKSHRIKIDRVAEYTQALDGGHGDEAETSERVHRAMRALPAKQREVVALVWFENFTHAEAAERIGCPESTVSWRMALAKRTLRKQLAR